MKRFEGKICLVTASSTGIGLAISERFAKEGGTVIINSRSKENVESVVQNLRKQGLKADGIICHAGKAEDRKKLLDHISKTYGRIDVLVPNVAVSTYMGSFLDMNEQAMDKMYDINLKSTFLLIKEAYPLMKGVKGANIIILSSYAAYEPDMTIGFYSITKTALLAMMKVLAKELKDDDIRVNCIAPGLIKTKFSSLLWTGKEKAIMEAMNINRLGEVEDIANLAAFLGSYEASYITGEGIGAVGKPLARL